LHPSAILNYPCYQLNFSLDIAIPDLMICFESDGSYWHKDQEKDLIRQKQIEGLGWKVIRYFPVDTIQQVPSIDQIKKDIENIIENKK
jgi:very-short-patch-repair endonuclease